MSLDGLFRQILSTEQQLTEQTMKIREENIATIRCTEKIKCATEKYEKTEEERDEKAQQLSMMKLQHDLMKKFQEQISKQVEELLCQKEQLQERLAEIKRESEEEAKNFLQEISGFNGDFSLQENSDLVFEAQMHTEILDLEREVDSLYQEMELMKCRNSHIISMQEEKRVLQVDLQDLGNLHKDLDRQLKEAEAVTESLREERQFVSQKPLTDSTCLRLREELEMHKVGELELLREALSSEIQSLQSLRKLESSQGNE